MHLCTCRGAYCRIANHRGDEHADIDAANCHKDRDTHVNSHIHANTGAIAHLHSDGRANPRAVTRPLQARHLCAIASLARL